MVRRHGESERLLCWGIKDQCRTGQYHKLTHIDNARTRPALLRSRRALFVRSCDPLVSTEFRATVRRNIRNHRHIHDPERNVWDAHSCRRTWVSLAARIGHASYSHKSAAVGAISRIQRESWLRQCSRRLTRVPSTARESSSLRQSYRWYGRRTTSWRIFAFRASGM